MDLRSLLPVRDARHGVAVVAASALRPSQGAGFAAGMLAAFGIIIGPVVAPLFAALVGLAVGEWVASGERERLHGLGIGAFVGLAIGRGLFAPAGFVSAWPAALPVAALPLLLSLAPPLTPHRRQLVALAATTVAVAVALSLS